MHKDAPHLDGEYAAFGRVIEGIEVVDEIAKTRVDYYYNRPYEKQIIKSIEVIDEEIIEPVKM
jgi:peptidyl-prolyl cis-trans isomerase B (cyclophilin B)